MFSIEKQVNRSSSKYFLSSSSKFQDMMDLMEKVIHKENNVMDEEKFWEEIAVLRRLKHPNVIRLYDVFQNEEAILAYLASIKPGRRRYHASPVCWALGPGPLLPTGG